MVVRLLIEVPEQSKNKDAQAVEKALILMESVAKIQKCITNLEGQLSVSDSDPLSINTELQSTKDHLAIMKAALDANLATLGVEEIKELKKLKTSCYLQDRMNART